MRHLSTGICNLSSKNALRSALTEARENLSPSARKLAEQAANTYLAQHAIFNDYQTFALYHAKGYEFPTAKIIQMLWSAGKHCFLPILTPIKTLEFGLYEQETVLTPNAFNILEPKTSPRRFAEELEIVFLPCLGMDSFGHRLGMGGGYYDRTFAFKKCKALPLLIGLGFECQKVSQLITDIWDVNLDGLMTEQGLVLF